MRRNAATPGRGLDLPPGSFLPPGSSSVRRRGGSGGILPPDCWGVERADREVGRKQSDETCVGERQTAMLLAGGDARYAGEPSMRLLAFTLDMTLETVRVGGWVTIKLN